MNASSQGKINKILLLFIILSVGFLIFLGVALYISIYDRDLPYLYMKKTSKATRGSIISADNYTIASSQKLYRAVINTHYLDPNKKDLFIKLFSIYSGMEPNELYMKIDPKMQNGKKGVLTLSYSIAQKEAEYLKQLAYELNRMRVFVQIENQNSGRRVVQGLNIVENGEGRVYNHGDLLTPLVGYINRVVDGDYAYSKGIKGVEKSFDDDLVAKEDELVQGQRDANGYILLNADSFTRAKENGLDIKLTIPVALQFKIEKMLDEMKLELDAKEIMIALMDGKNGDILSLASSNRFDPNSIKKDDYPSLNNGIIENSYEPGSVIKAITYALLLDKNLINPYDMIDGHNGRYKLGKRFITDEHKFDRLSAQEAIIHSSNIAIAQMAQKLSANDMASGFTKFGFAKPSIKELAYEQSGSLPHPKQLESEVYKATVAYGYGMRANLMQLLRAYSAFNNNGEMLNPSVVKGFIDSQRRFIEAHKDEPTRVIESKTASRVKDVLVQTVNIGTGTKTKIDGLEIGGKTGTAHIVEGGKYVKKYNTSFIGFANDKNRRYNLAVRVLEPKKSQFSAQTSVPVFKKVVDILVEDGYLKPDIIKEPSLTDLSLD
ncbi:MAG: penicillin-binding protein 2 [Sulfurimonas sp.]|jgi:cell division protein FtsI (penicillin-binding protein 3)|nr:penicillin-binding protein 2 [Sulfurimonadaceae bacterium]